MDRKVNRRTVIRLSGKLPSDAAVGRQLGITRERVRQICKDVVWEPPEGYLPIDEASKKLNYAHSTLSQMVKWGIIDGIFHKGRLYIKVSSFNPGRCEICGGNIDKGKRRYCGKKACIKEAARRAQNKKSLKRFHLDTGQPVDIPYFAPKNPRESLRNRYGNQLEVKA